MLVKHNAFLFLNSKFKGAKGEGNGTSCQCWMLNKKRVPSKEESCPLS